MAETLTIRSGDGTELRGAFHPGRDPRGVLIVSHGLGEYGGAYAPLAERLSSLLGLVDVLTFDYRGHGLSPGSGASSTATSTWSTTSGPPWTGSRRLDRASRDTSWGTPMAARSPSTRPSAGRRTSPG